MFPHPQKSVHPPGVPSTYLDALNELGGGLGQDARLVDHLLGVRGLGEHLVGDGDDRLHARLVCRLFDLLLGAVPETRDAGGGSSEAVEYF